MRLPTLFLLSAALLPGLVPPAPAASNPPPPRLVCDAPVFRFGTLTNQPEIAHTFLLRNTGGTPALILQLAASCGCVVPRLAQTNIPPGGEAPVLATFTLAGRKGPQRRDIRVFSNDPDNPCLTLWLEGSVAADADGFTPATLNFGNVRPDEAATRTLELAVAAGIRLTNVVCDAPAFEASLAANGRQVSIRTRPPLPNGPLRATLRGLTDAPALPAVSAQLLAMVVPDLHILPSTITLPRNEPYATRSIWVRPGTVTAYTITGVTCTAPDVQPLLQAVAPNIYRIDLRNLAVSEKLHGQRLIITTNLRNPSTWEVPILLEDPARSGAGGQTSQ